MKPPPRFKIWEGRALVFKPMWGHSTAVQFCVRLESVSPIFVFLMKLTFLSNIE